MASPLQLAPAATLTPVPGSFALDMDPSTEEFDGGAVLFGGTPPSLFRISERGRDVVARWKDHTPVGATTAEQKLARRLISVGAFAPRPTSSTRRPEDVTIVIPVRDRPAQLERVLRALHTLSCIVVDDASADAGRTKEIAERHGAVFVGLAANGGPSVARNAGLASLQHGDIVAFVDSDCIPADGWLEPLLGHFDDPRVAAVAPRIVAVGGPRGPLARYQSVRSSLDQGPDAALVRAGSRVSFVPSAAILVRRDVARGPDLFDPALRSGEDVDLVWRLVEAGWDVRYDPTATVAHEAPASVGAHLARTAFYGATAAPLARRHRATLHPVEVSAWSLAVWALTLARRPALAQATLATSVAILASRLSGLVRDPVAVATRIAGGGTAKAFLPALGHVARAWSPALVLGLAFRRTRQASALALLLPALKDWAAGPDAADLWSYLALHVADDAAYGAGLWAGCVREKTAEPLVPRVSWRSAWLSARALRDRLGGPRAAG
jgi:mycofactocin system glycosyltransferase